jgi:hypothetical protein
MAEPCAFPFGGSADARAAHLSLADRLRRHADAFVRSGRSPLGVQIMRASATDIDAGGTMAQVFAGVSVTPGTNHCRVGSSRRGVSGSRCR